MLNLSKKLKMIALAGLSAATLAGFATPASARQAYTTCGAYRCYRVVCDNDGDDCRRVATYDRYNRYERDNRYRDGRRWVCDRDGDDCRWVYPDRYGRYRDSSGVYLRLNLGR